MRTKFRRVARVFWAFMLPLGCSTQHYEIRMTPKGNGVERVLTVSRTTVSKTNFIPVLEQEVARIASAFQQEWPPEKDRHFRFQSNFSKNLPNDVGGHGTYVRWDSPCGSVTGYIERFRGNDDLIGQLDAIREAVGKMIDLFDRWAETEWGTAEFFPRMRESLRTPIRRDLENLLCLFYVSRMSEKKDEDIHRDIGARIIQYMLERHYLEPDDVPKIVRALSNRDDIKQEAAFIHEAETLVIRLLRLEDNQATREGLQFSTKLDDSEKSFEKFLAATPEYLALRHEAAKRGESKKIEPMDVFKEPLYRMLFGTDEWALLEEQHVVVQLNTTVEPTETNGNWIAEKAAVVWDFKVEPRRELAGQQIPRICYAFWGEPHVEFQKTHFGDVALHGENLTTYCLWYRALTPDEARQWDQFIDGLHPDETFRSKLQSFRFTGEPMTVTEKGDATSLATAAVQLILDKQKK